MIFIRYTNDDAVYYTTRVRPGEHIRPPVSEPGGPVPRDELTRRDLLITAAAITATATVVGTKGLIEVYNKRETRAKWPEGQTELQIVSGTDMPRPEGMPKVPPVFVVPGLGHQEGGWLAQSAADDFLGKDFRPFYMAASVRYPGQGIVHEELGAAGAVLAEEYGDGHLIVVSDSMGLINLIKGTVMLLKDPRFAKWFRENPFHWDRIVAVSTPTGIVDIPEPLQGLARSIHKAELKGDALQAVLYRFARLWGADPRVPGLHAGSIQQGAEAVTEALHGNSPMVFMSGIHALCTAETEKNIDILIEAGIITEDTIMDFYRSSPPELDGTVMVDRAYASWSRIAENRFKIRGHPYKGGHAETAKALKLFSPLFWTETLGDKWQNAA